MIGTLISVVGEDARKPLGRNLAGLIIESILMGIGFVLLTPFLRALLQGNEATAWRWLAVMAGVVLVYTIVRYRTQLDGYYAAVGLSRALFARLGDHIARLPLGWFGAERVGQIGRMTGQGVIDVMGVPAHLLRPVVTAVATPATVILLMFLFDWRLALAALLTFPVAALAYRWTGDLVQRTDARVDAAAAEAAGRIVEFAQAQAVLRAFGKGEASLGNLDASLKEQHAAGRSQIMTASRGFSSFVFTLQLAFTVILLFGVNLALGGSIEAAELVALLVLSVRYVEPLIGAADLEGALRIARNSLERMDALVATEPLAEPVHPRQPSNAEIVFESVKFSYDENPLLTDICFTAPEKSMTAIVGGSGSGKTTILRLIARFWDVNAGAVRIGGVDVREMTTEDLMARISVVFQDVYLFDGTIAENIRLGRPSASDDEIRNAARLARVDEIMERLPGGLDAPVGEGGSILSGGERQRVSIARAILKDAPIILLDEATSALDPVNEAAVQAGLRALTKDKTLIVVAHRLQTVCAADQILVLSDGKIAECGKHDDLMARNGKYAAFWKERSRAAGWRIAA
ncbi:MAG: ABC transporter ATP-binding protein, partial [Pseudomonadota bacterium]